MRKEVICFVGHADMVKLFHRAMARNFNVHYPEEENRLAGNGLVAVTYSVIAINDDFCNTSEMLRDIAEHVILAQEKHNAHSTASMVEYEIIEG